MKTDDDSTGRPILPAHALFHWTCEFGTFWIAKEIADPTQYCIGRGTETFSSYHSPEAAAEDFLLHMIGDETWDSCDIEGPEALVDWLRVGRHTRGAKEESGK